MTKRDIGCTKEGFSQVCSQYRGFADVVDYSEFWSCALAEVTLSCNVDSSVSYIHGVFDVGDGAVNVDFLEDHFQHPLYPTENECLLFELEYGAIYPLDKRNLIKEK